MLRKKLTGLLVAALCLLPTFSQAYTINGNLDVRGNIVGGVREIGQTNNLTLSLASGILKIQCGNADCSTSNPGWITLPSNTAGQMVTYKITSSPQFGDATAGDSDFVGTGTCSWGTTAAVAWGNAMPLLLVAAHDGSTVVFGMARGPVLTTGASTNIGYQDNCPSSASQNNVIFMTSTNVTSSHANKGVTPIGAVRSTKNSSDDYTFQTLDNGDGIGNFYNFGSRIFNFPTGQMGAAANKNFLDNGGIAPVFSVNIAQYTVSLSGYFIYFWAFDGDGGTDGTGAVETRLAAPVRVIDNAGTAVPSFKMSCFMKWGATNTQLCGATIQDGVSYINFFRNNSTTSTSAIQNADFINGARELSGLLIFKGY